MPLPHVIISNAQTEWQPYIDWLATGLHILTENDDITFNFEPKDQPFLSFLARTPSPIRRFLSPLYRAGAQNDGSIIHGKIRFRDRSVSFVYDMKDSPFDIDVILLEKTDLYFKCQCPISIDPEGFPLNSRIRIPYDPKVIALQNKIRPAMLGRPLSCSLNFRKSVSFLSTLESLNHSKKDNHIFASFGSDKPPGKHSESDFEISEIMARYAGRLEHPNIKRGKIVRFIKENLAEKTDVRIISSDDPIIQAAPLNKKDFFERIADSVFDVNISGYRRSLTHRLATGFMLGTAVISDELAVKWYEPFEEGVEIFDLGKLGYELPEACGWDVIYNALKEWHTNAEALSATIRPKILDRFHKFWHPMSLARYIIRECERCL